MKLVIKEVVKAKSIIWPLTCRVFTSIAGKLIHRFPHSRVKTSFEATFDEARKLEIFLSLVDHVFTPVRPNECGNVRRIDPI